MSATASSNGHAPGLELQRVPSIPRGQELADLTTLGNHLGQSGFFKDVQTGYQAFAKLLFGRDLGLSATAAMTGVHIIEGKPEISANIQAQMVRTYIGPEGERYDYEVIEHSSKACRIRFSRRRDGEWKVLGESEYSLNDAGLAGLAGKANWKKHPRNMLFARAMSDGVAFHCPEVTNGIRTYHEGEIDVDGSVRAVAESAPLAEVPMEEVEVVDGVVVPEGAAESASPQPTARTAGQSERPATAKQKGMLRKKAETAGLSAIAFANVLKVAQGEPPSQSTDEAAAVRFLDRAIDRLPARLVDAVIAGIADAASGGSQA